MSRHRTTRSRQVNRTTRRRAQRRPARPTRRTRSRRRTQTRQALRKRTAERFRRAAEIAAGVPLTAPQGPLLAQWTMMAVIARAAVERLRKELREEPKAALSLSRDERAREERHSPSIPREDGREDPPISGETTEPGDQR